MIQNHISQSRFNRCALLLQQLAVILVMPFLHDHAVFGFGLRDG